MKARSSLGRLTEDLDAVVFDFDGTLVDSNALKAEAFGKLYESEGPEVVQAVMEYHREHEGISRFVKFRYWEEVLLGRPWSEAQGEELSKQYSILVREAVIQAPYLPGALASLEALHSALPLYVASGTPEAELQEIVDCRGLNGYFQGVYGTPQTKAEILNRIAQLHGTPSRILMIGDARADWEGAQQSGVLFLGVHAQGEPAPFDATVRTVPDLTRLLELRVSTLRENKTASPPPSLSRDIFPKILTSHS